MADKPKDKPEKSSYKDGYEYLQEIIFILLLLMVASAFVSQIRSYGFGSATTATSTATHTTVSSGSIKEGKYIYNIDKVSVRGTPAGRIIGTQEKREKGLVTAGPAQSYGEIWWKMDYENAPDGWVEEKFITGKRLSFLAVNFIPMVWGYWKVISLWIIILFSIGITYVLYRMYSLDKKHDEKEKKEESLIIRQQAEPMSAAAFINKTNSAPGNLPVEEVIAPQRNERWEHIEMLIESMNPSDWRQAIIEADIVLEEMLDKMGYDGQTIGDKLKNVEESDFLTLDKAWEAHKVRNRIAHSGSSYKLGQSDARRVIGLYKKVFEEFYFI